MKNKTKKKINTYNVEISIINEKYIDDIILSLIYFGYSIQYHSNLKILVIKSLSKSGCIKIDHNDTFEICIETNPNKDEFEINTLHKNNFIIGIARQGYTVYESGENRNDICFIIDFTELRENKF